MNKPTYPGNTTTSLTVKCFCCLNLTTDTIPGLWWHSAAFTTMLPLNKTQPVITFDTTTI